MAPSLPQSVQVCIIVSTVIAKFMHDNHPALVNASIGVCSGQIHNLTLINVYTTLILIDIFPQHWAQVDKLLTKAGCSSPIEFSVCYDPSHPNKGNLLRNGAHCSDCNGKGSVPLYYLSIAEKIRQWCGNEDMCRKMTAHWADRDSWMNGPAHKAPEMLNELWHGCRFRELSWFWDPSSV